ncbi:MAG: fumarylacetoacetate hydrolase family protein [Lentisphaeraceae bacterium]|nr:fumarylacetoacetate hydrolase family protein [Lentisphaeraceae bacterium]
MKLATRKNDCKDGELIVVSRDLTRAHSAAEFCSTLQQALDNWEEVSPKLENLYKHLNLHDVDNIFPFETHELAAPLPRAYQWLDGSAYVSHVELVRKARGAEMPKSFWTDPLMYQGGSDNFIGPNDHISIADESWGIDFEAEIVVITSDVPMGITVKGAQHHILLIGLINDISLRNLIPKEISKSFGFVHSKPACSFSPVFVTPDELGSQWKDTSVHLQLISKLNGELFGNPNAGVDMTFNFSKLIAHAAKTRTLMAGTIIGSGTVSNKSETCGSSCIAERRMREKLKTGTAKSSFMKFGDTVKIEMLDGDNKSIFGAIEQTVHPYINLLYQH